MQALEMEEVESLVGPGRKKLNQSRQGKKATTDGLISALVKRDFVGYIVGVAMVAIVLLLYWASHDAADGGKNTNTNTNTNPVDLEYKPSTPSSSSSSSIPAPEAVVAPPPTNPPVAPAPTPPPTTAPPTDPPKPVDNSMNLYSKFATFIPLVEPPLPDEETRMELAKKWEKWKFWDGEEDMRPKVDYLSSYPNKDCPGDELPDDAWQADAVFVNHYLNDADKLISRAMEAIFAEYGHPREGLAPVQLAQRMQQFHWEKVDMKDADKPPPGSGSKGGWTTKRSEQGLVRRLLHAMMTSDTFTVVMGGHSAAAGEGNHFRQSYMMQFHKVMAPIFAHLGVKLITRNIGMGGLGTLHNAMGMGSIYGDDIDLLIWDSGMTEGKDLAAVDMFLRQGLIGGKRVPVIWGSGLNFNLLKNIHENAGADIGEFGQATDLLPVVESREQAETIPWAARYLKCSDDAQPLCKEEPRFCAQCWVDRDDGIAPSVTQLSNPRGQVSWHPGWRPHQLVGRNLAMGLLQSLQNAINIWNENVAAGPPLPDEFWHITEYYDNIRNKVMNMKDGSCYDFEGRLPSRMCNTPMKALTHYTPRVDPEKTGINVFVKPASDGYVPLNEKKNLYDGPDPPNPCLQIPDGEVDVYAIVAGRRRLSGEEAWNATKKTQHSSFASNMTPVTSSVLVAKRNLETGIVPGKGWQLFGEPPGYCDGTYNSICNRAADADCILQGHQVARGAIVGNEYSGWLVVNLKDVKEGVIVLKLHTWHYADENTITAGWTTVNNEPPRLRERKMEERNINGTQNAMDMVAEIGISAGYERRSLGVRSTDTPEQPDTMVFEYAIDGKITTLPRDQFLEKVQHLQRVVETLTILDDPNFTSEPKDVEIAIRMRGCERKCSFGLSHVYWA